MATRRDAITEMIFVAGCLGILIAIGTLLAACEATPVNGPVTFGEWLEADPTDEHEYIDGDYMCLQFSDDFIQNATSAGYNNVYLVGIIGPACPDGHYVIALADGAGNYVLIEPQTDQVILIPGLDDHRICIVEDYWLVPEDPTLTRYYTKDIMVDTVIHNTTQGGGYVFRPVT
jgi:hypothetical protein